MSLAVILKEGVAIEQQEPEALYPLLRFHTTASPEEWISLDEYIGRMKENQPAIYYIMGDDPHSVVYSPHLDLVRKYDYEVLLLTDPVDAFMLVRLNKYKDHALVNVANADLKAPEAEKDQAPEEQVPAEAHAALAQRFKDLLGDKVDSVRMTDRLTDSPARLVDPEGAPNQEWQRVYRALKEDFVAPKKVLELNPRHADPDPPERPARRQSAGRR